MNQNQTQNPIERFNKHYDAKQAVDMTVQAPVGEQIEKTYIDPSNCVGVFPTSVEKVGTVHIPSVDASPTEHTTLTREIGGDDYELVRLQAGSVTHHIQTKYVDMVCETFDVNESTFYENVCLQTNKRDLYPVVYKGEEYSAIISPVAVDL